MILLGNTKFLKLNSNSTKPECYYQKFTGQVGFADEFM